jgi:hypothetical protein
MGYRRYHRKRSMTGEALADTAFIANRLSWKGATIFGAVQFVVFYWLLPAWINHQLDSLQNNMFRPMVEVVFARRVHWLQWLAIALALVCTFFAVRNYFASERLGRYGESNVSFFSRLLARWLD